MFLYRVPAFKTFQLHVWSKVAWLNKNHFEIDTCILNSWTYTKVAWVPDFRVQLHLQYIVFVNTWINEQYYWTLLLAMHHYFTQKICMSVNQLQFIDNMCWARLFSFILNIWGSKAWNKQPYLNAQIGSIDSWCHARRCVLLQKFQTLISLTVHLPFGRRLRYLVIRPIKELVPGHEDQSIDAKTIWGPASRFCKPSFGT